MFIKTLEIKVMLPIGMFTVLTTKTTTNIVIIRSEQIKLLL